jgi:hypothetical protein
LLQSFALLYTKYQCSRLITSTIHELKLQFLSNKIPTFLCSNKHYLYLL